MTNELDLLYPTKLTNIAKKVTNNFISLTRQPNRQFVFQPSDTFKDRKTKQKMTRKSICRLYLFLSIVYC